MEVTVTLPDDFYIAPSEAARLLDVRVTDLAAFQASGDLNNVLVTYQNWRKFNLAEVAQLRQRLIAAGDHG